MKDKVKTSILGKRVYKDDLRIETLGTLDEVQSFLSLVLAKIKDRSLRSVLRVIQKDLFVVGSEIADIYGKTKIKKIDKKRVEFLEKKIKELEKEVKPKKFSLLGDSENVCYLDILRTAVRRLERRLVSLYRKKSFFNLCTLSYVNKLSYLIYLYECKLEKKKEGL